MAGFFVGEETSMADDPKGDGGTPNPKDPKADGSGGDWEPLSREETEALQRHARNKEEEAARHAEKLKKIDDDAKKANEDRARKAGEYDKLLAERDAKLAAQEARLKAIEDAHKAELADMLKGLSDDDKALVPESLPIEERLTLAKKLTARLSTTHGSTKPAGSRNVTAHGGFESDEEWAKADYPAYKAYRDMKK
jgi:flagellar motility protein MotE (MotC chaperone)